MEKKKKAAKASLIPNEQKLIEELNKTESWIEFDEWAQRWLKQGCSLPILENIVCQLPHFKDTSLRDEALMHLREIALKVQ